MSEVTSRIRIKFVYGEIEIEGSEDFIREQLSSMSEVLDQWKLQPISGICEVGSELSSDNKDQSSSVPVHFGEYYQKFPNTIKDTDRFLIAGYFVQSNSPNNSFSTGEANTNLRDNNVKLSNPSQAAVGLKQSKKIFKVENGWKVSETGISYLESLKSI